MSEQARVSQVPFYLQVIPHTSQEFHLWKDQFVKVAEEN